MVNRLPACHVLNRHSCCCCCWCGVGLFGPGGGRKRRLWPYSHHKRAAGSSSHHHRGGGRHGGGGEGEALVRECRGAVAGLVLRDLSHEVFWELRGFLAEPIARPGQGIEEDDW